MTAPIMNLEQFAAARGGLVTDADVQAHIHAGLRSAPQWKSYQRRHAAMLAKLQAQRDETKRLYCEAIAAGEIRKLSNLERLTATAAGHPDNEATRAAQRILAKRRAFLESAS